MPNKDHTGPEGKGPTGHGRGGCPGAKTKATGCGRGGHGKGHHGGKGGCCGGHARHGCSQGESLSREEEISQLQRELAFLQARLESLKEAPAL